MTEPSLSPDRLAGMIDHANLKPTATRQDLRSACDLVLARGCASLCVRPFEVAHAADILKESPVLVSTVIGYPHGTNASSIKVAETLQVLDDGARELDMVLNIARLIEGDTSYVTDEIASVVTAAAGVTVKVILECCCLNQEQIAAGCEAAMDARAHYVKTSTGFGEYGARLEDVRLMRQTVGEAAGVKAAGGIRTLADARAMIEAGATRLGTSATATILDELAGG